MKKLFIVFLPFLFLLQGCTSEKKADTETPSSKTSERSERPWQGRRIPREITPEREADLKEKGFTDEEIEQMKSGEMTDELREKIRASGGFSRSGEFRARSRALTEARINKLKEAGFTQEEIEQLQSNKKITNELREKIRETGVFRRDEGALSKPEE